MIHVPSLVRLDRPAGPIALLGVVLILLLLPMACGGDAGADASAEASGPAASDAPSGDAHGAGQPAGLAPVTSRASDDNAAAPSSSAAASATVAADGPTADGRAIELPGGAVFHLPTSWREVPPTSSMRKAQAAIPAGDGGTEGDLTVFHFGPGGGGGVEANLQRWVGQVEVAGQPVRGEIDLGGGYKVTWVEARGTLKPSTMGMGPSEPLPDAVLLGAVAEGPGGPWFFKATGPASSLDPARDDFFAMMRSLGAAG